MGKVKLSKKRATATRTRKIKRGKGIVNSLINKLPFELHLPSYQYCGPGTKLKKRLVRNDPGINELDRACKQHDIAYSQSTDVAARNRADHILASKAWQRFKSKDAGLGERAAALGVSGVMKAKAAMGAGMKSKQRRKRKPKLGGKNAVVRRRTGLGMRFQAKPATSIPKVFQSAVKHAKHTIYARQPKSLSGAAKLALQAAKAAIKVHRIPRYAANTGLPRIIPVPKIGGMLPLVPIFAGLSALGALMGGSAGVANAVMSANKAKKDYNESKRHNQTMEAIALGSGGKNRMRAGAGLYLKPYKNGLGLFLTPFQQPSKNAY